MKNIMRGLTFLCNQLSSRGIIDQDNKNRSAIFKSTFVTFFCWPRWLGRVCAYSGESDRISRGVISVADPSRKILCIRGLNDSRKETRQALLEKPANIASGRN